jgi:hypothetical protein
MKRLLLVGVVLLLTGCGTARTLVLEPVNSSARFSRVELVENNANVQVPAEVTTKFRSVVEKGLYEKSAFTRGEDMRILYTFVSHNPGSQFQRWFWGGIGNAGEGSVAVTVKYVDAKGTELAKTQVEGRIGSGMFGGSYDEAIQKAGEEIVKFTTQHFAAR